MTYYIYYAGHIDTECTSDEQIVGIHIFLFHHLNKHHNIKQL